MAAFLIVIVEPPLSRLRKLKLLLPQMSFDAPDTPELKHLKFAVEVPRPPAHLGLNACEQCSHRSAMLTALYLFWTGPVQPACGEPRSETVFNKMLYMRHRLAWIVA